jgi:hypothetical protein
MKKYLFILINMLIINKLSAQNIGLNQEKMEAQWQLIQKIEQEATDSLTFQEINKGNRKVKIIAFQDKKLIPTAGNEKVYLEKVRYNLKGTQILKRYIYRIHPTLNKIRLYRLIMVNQRIVKFDYAPAKSTGFKIRNNRLFSKNSYKE